MQGMQLVRGLMTSSAAAAAAPALATKSSGGLAAMLGFGCSRVDVPLSEALPSVPKPLKATLPSVAPKLVSSTLDAGAKVAAVETASPLTTVAVVLNGGSAYETDATSGASKVLEHMAFKATANRTTFRLTRELEKIGAVAYSKAGRDTISFAIDTVKLHAAEATEILLDSVLNPKLNYWEVSETAEVVEQQLRTLLADPSNVVTEVLHRAAFDGALGKPLLVDPSVAHGFSNETLKEYVASILHPSNLLVAGVGISHDELKGLANPLVQANGAAPEAKAASSYVGGSFNVVGNSPLTHVALAFEAKGGLSDPKAAAASAVVQALLDHSRAPLPWTRKESDVFQSVDSFSYQYKNTGLVGVLASAAPQKAGALIDSVSKQIEAVAKGVSEAQLSVAKKVAIGAYKASLATSGSALSVIAPQLLLSGSFSSSDFVSKVEALTAADVASFVQKAVKTAPTLVTYGSLAYLPRYESIAKRFN